MFHSNGLVAIKPMLGMHTEKKPANPNQSIDTKFKICVISREVRVGRILVYRNMIHLNSKYGGDESLIKA